MMSREDGRPGWEGQWHDIGRGRDGGEEDRQGGEMGGVGARVIEGHASVLTFFSSSAGSVPVIQGWADELTRVGAGVGMHATSTSRSWRWGGGQAIIMGASSSLAAAAAAAAAARSIPAWHLHASLQGASDSSTPRHILSHGACGGEDLLTRSLQVCLGGWWGDAGAVRPVQPSSCVELREGSLQSTGPTPS